MKQKINKNYISPENIDKVCSFLLKLEKYSNETFEHSIDTANRSLVLGLNFNLNKDELSDLYTAALLHDIGKLKVPLKILHGQKLDDKEKKFLQLKHITQTKQLLKNHFSENIVDIAYKHHEKLNKSGYPEGLGKKDLNLQSRILAVADIASSLLMDRTYRKALSKEKTQTILEEMVKNKELDAKVVNACLNEYITHLN